MPGFDGTGPGGMGPMTGRGQGQCAAYVGSYRPWGRRNFYGWGRGGGRGWRHRFWATGLPYWNRRGWAGFPHPMSGDYGPPVPQKEDLEMLKARSETLSQMLKDISERIREREAAGQ